MHERPRLLDHVRDRLRFKHYGIRTEQAYVEWVRRFVVFCELRHPRDMGLAEVEAFLTHLAVDGRVAAATQNLAKSSMLFLYREVLGSELPWLDGVERAKRPARLPVVLTREEVQAVLGRGSAAPRAGVEAAVRHRDAHLECLRLRVKDVDFARREIWCGTGRARRIA